MPAPYSATATGTLTASGCQIDAVIWEGATTAGDTVELRDPVTNSLLWKGRTPDTQTYLGFSPRSGIPAPNGVKVAQISSGQVLVYLR
jgi:hypothetical protein